MRKHYSQMSQAELDALLSIIRSKFFKFTGHAVTRMREKNILTHEVLDSIKHGVIIEVHNDYAPDIRAVIRREVTGKAVCTVVSLTKSQVITTYCNAAGDNHATLDRSKYQWTQDITKILWKT